MPENPLVNRLKSIEISALDGDLGAPDDALILSQTWADVELKGSPTSSLIRAQIIESVDILIKQARFASYKNIIKQYSWRCTHTFAHQNNRVCNTVNGTYRKDKKIRKTCQKCMQPRKNPLTIQQELKELIIADLVAEGMNEEEAREKIYGNDTKQEVTQ